MNEFTHRVIVMHRSGPEWRLYKRLGRHWIPCRRSHPEDATAFDLADKCDWLEMPEGTYGLSVPVASEVP